MKSEWEVQKNQIREILQIGDMMGMVRVGPGAGWVLSLILSLRRRLSACSPANRKAVW